MRCGRCGNDNADANRFCGMCGAPLAAPQSAAPSSSVASVGNVALPTSKPVTQSSRIAIESLDPALVARRPAVPSSAQSEPRRDAVITGPSFLGLNQGSLGADGGGHRERHDTSIGHGPPEAHSGSLDYLLDDEDEPKRGGVKLFLVVVLLAIAIGVGYLRWKRGNFDWLGINKAEVIAPANSASNGPESGTSGSSSTPNSTTPSPSANAPVTPIPTDSAAPTPTNSEAANAGSGPAATQAATPPQVSGGAQTAQPDAAAATPNGAAADSAAHPSASNSEAESKVEEPPPPAPAKVIARKPAKPSAAKSLGSMSNDSVAEAERYIYGRGVVQDCDRGLRLLKPAAAQSNPKAMISLGALYSTGTCTPRDLPTSYRWFALALHQQPDNQVLQNDLQKLWSQMTQPERQLAIKLSQ